MERSSGILMPLFSLPSPYGIGTMGAAARCFIDFLAAAKQRWWQLLPLGPAGSGDSPYCSPSAYAGNPCFIDPDMLVQQGLLKKSEPAGMDWGSDSSRVDYEKVNKNKLSLLQLAFTRVGKELKAEIDAFRLENRDWLEDYALFTCISEWFGKDLSWTKWPEDIRRRDPAAMARYARELKEEIDFVVFVQYLFFSQWKSLREYANEKGIGFIGDIPIYVAMESSDVWSETRFFQLDEDCLPKEVSGVPPDAFTDEGQLWGNPLFDWDMMERDGYGWWIRRIGGASKLYDIIRIDHFRGLAAYWAVPYGAKTAKEGHWREGPGMKLVHVLTSWFNTVEYIAEDLGIMTGEVIRLLEASGLPGMKVLQFGFDPASDSAYMPHNIPRNCVCYTGTHDNNTLLGWVEEMSEEELVFLTAYIHKTRSESWFHALTRTGMSSAAVLYISTMQDLLGLGGECRTNTPGTPTGNWRWRMLPGSLAPELAQELAEMTRLYRRA